jgi:hypothetical protein
MIKVPSNRVSAAEFDPTPNPHSLEACRAYAKAMNTCSTSALKPWLSDEFTYSSQWVMEDLKGKDPYLDYLKGKFETIQRSGSSVWAEIGYTRAFGAGLCVILAQDKQENLVATVLIEMKDALIEKISMCGIPSPYECDRTGEFPK